MMPISRVPGVPLLGNSHQILSGQLHTVFETWARDHGPCCTFRMPGRDGIIIADLEMAVELLKRRPTEFRRLRSIESTIRALGAHGIFSAEGEDWKRQTRLVKGAFSRKSIDASFDVLELVTGRLLRSWRNQTDVPFDARAQLMCFTADVTTLLAFGYDLNTIEQESELQGEIQKIFETIGRRVAAPIPYWRVLPLPRDRAALEAVDAVKEVVLRVIRDAGRRTDGRQTLLDGMLEARSQEDFSDDEVFGNVMTLLLAGEDTTANGMAWLLYYLGRDPKLQEQIREEAEAALGDRIVPASLADLEGLELTRAALREALRLRSPGPFVLLEPVQDTTVDGLHLPKGTMVVVLTRYIATQEAHFSEPHRFLPERWLRKPSEDWNHNLRAMMAFGSGPRTCPGAQLATIETQVLLTAICRHFEIRFEGSDRDVDEIFSFVMHPRAMPIRARLRPAATEAPAVEERAPGPLPAC